MSTGEITDPFTLTEALDNDLMEPGHTLHLRAGTYAGDFTFPFVGNAENPIVIRPYGDEWVVIDGVVALGGGYYEMRDLELCWSGWSGRESSETGSTPTDLATKNLNGSGVHLKLINCIIHDYGSPFFGTAMQNLELYGCVIFHNGWLAPDRGHGHAIYIQNNVETMVVKDCTLFDCFGWGIHAYSSNGNNLKYIELVGNTAFSAGSLAGVARPNILLGAEVNQADAVTLRDNATYGGGGLQFYGAGATNVTLVDNYIPGGKTGIYTAIEESGNTYGVVGDVTFLRANDYDPNRANLTIYNETEADTARVDLSSLGWMGQVTARNVQDYFVDIQTLDIVDGAIVVNMQASNRTVSTPVQWTAPQSTFPQFGAFVLDRVP